MLFIGVELSMIC